MTSLLLAIMLTVPITDSQEDSAASLDNELKKSATVAESIRPKDPKKPGTIGF
jgi:hypothetical protein|tara:strand:- start:6067 stop:6225 length:159 start_codon:yes stop_codon:yes gene_type:complete